MLVPFKPRYSRLGSFIMKAMELTDRSGACVLLGMPEGFLVETANAYNEHACQPSSRQFCGQTIFCLI